MICLDLFLGFLKVGCFAFGGAYGAIPLIRDVVLSHGWLSDEALLTMIAVSESTPGPIMVNLATYVGRAQAGLPGAVAATLAVVLPSFAVILLVTAFLNAALKNPVFQAVLRGLKPCLAGIILATGVYWTGAHCVAGGSFDGRAAALTFTLAVLYFGSRKVVKNGLSPISLIVAAAVAGAAVYGLA